MSKPTDKFKNSKRRQKDENAIAKQVKIAKSHNTFNEENIKEPHRLVKHHAMDCGNPECYLCGNPRKTHKDKLTQQEKRLFQDLDDVRDKHSNGLVPKDE
ncbi:MAG: hypothetical protein RLZZ196_108 [Bacteroidota bacterium]|jgi:hypothetical protein